MEVQQGKTLALVGDQVSLEGGILKSPEGRIEIGSVSSNGTVSLVSVPEGWKLSYQGITNFEDIQFSRKPFLNTTGDGGGSIALAGQDISTFVSTGRGGLPMSPTEPLQDTSTLAQWVKSKTTPENSATGQIKPQPTAVSTTPKVAAATTPIVEATGWVVDGNGNIELVAQAPQVSPHSPWLPKASCPASQ